MLKLRPFKNCDAKKIVSWCKKEICSSEEYQMLEKAFFEKEENLKK